MPRRYRGRVSAFCFLAVTLLSQFDTMLNPLTWLFGFDRLLAKLEGFLLATTLITMLFFAFLQVVLRNLFDTGIIWGDVFARHLVLWVGFFGATLATREGKHIRIDALTKALPKRALPIIELFINIFCIIVGFLLFQAALKFMLDERMAGTILFEEVPTWYFITIMPFGFGVITFRYFIKLVELLMTFGGKKKELKHAQEHQELDISLKIKLK